MNASGFLYAAKMTNLLAIETPEIHWDKQLIVELGTLRKLFIHIVRVRDVYRDGLKTGVIQFPGHLPSNEYNLMDELERSMNELAVELNQTTFERIKMSTEYISTMEFQNTAVQHEGIHQGQYFVALKQAGLELPTQWVQDWGM
ncbi:DinB family protein [Alteribacter populi]|uniref:DinB family protein n=1 Tax=Alteribacter populi TaxID=2011011 RepID=UPI000BBA6232|nr:DinB family protein [Alteribacter populi]